MEKETTPEPVEMTTDRIQTIFGETTELFESSVQDILKQQSARHSPDAILVILMAIKSNCQQFINSFDLIIREEEDAEEDSEIPPEPLSDFYFSEKLKDAMQQIHGSKRKITTTFFQGKEYNFVTDHGEPLDGLIITDYVFIGTGKESETTTT